MSFVQRHEEPKLANEEYEQGTYVYFDFHIRSAREACLATPGPPWVCCVFSGAVGLDSALTSDKA